MDQGKGAGRSNETEELILRTIAAHAESLLRTARRHSICTDDAQDAYQRGLEIFMARAERLDPAGAPGWLHVVVKREAQAISRSRMKHVSASDPDVDSHQARRQPSPEDRVLTADLIGRSAEALQRLKPHELRALWLKAEGHSYNEIAALTGWSYTKVNRLLTEGRRSFLERFAAIESGAECERWMPIISAIVDGEATRAQLLELRPHLRNCPGCRATLKALQDSSASLSAVLPVALAVVPSDNGEQLSSLVTRAYEAIAGGLQDRALHSVAKAQAALEAATGGKVAAVAASAAAAAGGGYATMERTVTGDRADAARTPARHEAPRRATKVAAASAAAAPTAAPLSERRIQPVLAQPRKVAAGPAATAPSEFEPGAAAPTRTSSSSTSTARATPTARSASLTRASSARQPAGTGATAAAAGGTSVEYASTAGTPEFAP